MFSKEAQPPPCGHSRHEHRQGEIRDDDAATRVGTKVHDWASSWICGLHRSDFECVLRYRGAEERHGSEETACSPNGTYSHLNVASERPADGNLTRVEAARRPPENIWFRIASMNYRGSKQSKKDTTFLYCPAA